MAAPAQPAAASAPRVVYVANSQYVKGGAPPAPAAGAPGTAAPAGTAAAPAAGQAPAAGAAAPAQAKTGASMLSRILGLLPLASGITQAAVGFLITRGTISLVGIPLLGSMPAFLVGSLVAATAMPTVVQGIGKLLGKTPAAPAR